jgi:hypothetical protein
VDRFVESLQAVSPVVLIAVILGGVLLLFAALLSLRVGWERNALGLRAKWKRRQRRRRREPPSYPPLDMPPGARPPGTGSEGAGPEV